MELSRDDGTTFYLDVQWQVTTITLEFWVF
jgi:hypothetical protein